MFFTVSPHIKVSNFTLLILQFCQKYYMVKSLYLHTCFVIEFTAQDASEAQCNFPEQILILELNRKCEKLLKFSKMTVFFQISNFKSYLTMFKHVRYSKMGFKFQFVLENNIFEIKKKHFWTGFFIQILVNYKVSFLAKKQQISNLKY